MRKDYKYEFLQQLLAPFEGKKISIVDMGSGTSANFLPFIQENPLLDYTGIEFYPPSAQKAAELYKGVPNARFISGFGEDQGSSLEGKFDLVISLSVLEHVKNLKDFLKQSVSFGKSGALIVHRYDLGHSLYPNNRGEALRVWVSKAAPFLLSKRRFTTHPSLPFIIDRLTEYGVEGITADSSQIAVLKAMMNKLRPGEEDEALAEELLKIERFLKEKFFSRLSPKEREYLFPTITVTGRKK